MLPLGVRWEHIRQISPRALQSTIGCPNLQHLWHCVVADACHITADVLYFPINRTDGVKLSTSVSGTLIIIEVAFLALLSSSFGFRNFAPAISNLSVTLKAVLTSSSRSLSLFEIAVSDTPWIMTSTSVGALLKGRYFGSSGSIVLFWGSVILSVYFAYCPECVPVGAVRVIVQFVLLENTWRLVGALHSQPVRTVAPASEILASSLVGSAMGFAVILVAHCFRLATFVTCLSFGLSFLHFSLLIACCSCISFAILGVCCFGGVGPATGFLFPLAGVAFKLVPFCGTCAAPFAYDLAAGSDRCRVVSPVGAPSGV